MMKGRGYGADRLVILDGRLIKARKASFQDKEVIVKNNITDAALRRAEAEDTFVNLI